MKMIQKLKNILHKEDEIVKINVFVYKYKTVKMEELISVSIKFVYELLCEMSPFRTILCTITIYKIKRRKICFIFLLF